MKSKNIKFNVVLPVPYVIYRLEVKPELCAGCERCMLVCSLIHNSIFDPNLARIKVIKDYFSGDYRVNVCRQCFFPPCMAVCPNKAIDIDPKTGAKIINNIKCVGCKQCIDACPYKVISYNESIGKVFKCDLCQGMAYCVNFCPMQAIQLVRVKNG